MSDWWLPQVQSQLSQGDVIDVLPVASILRPAMKLKKADIPGAKGAWAPSDDKPDGGGNFYFIAKGAIYPALVLSHSCDLDKNESRERVLLAPLRPASENPNGWPNIVAQKRRSMMPLPAIPTIGDHYADLRMVQSISRELVGDAKRLASMTEEALVRLHQQIVGFLVRPPSQAWVREETLKFISGGPRPYEDLMAKLNSGGHRRLVAQILAKMMTEKLIEVQADGRVKKVT